MKPLCSHFNVCISLLWCSVLPRNASMPPQLYKYIQWFVSSSLFFSPPTPSLSLILFFFLFSVINSLPPPLRWGCRSFSALIDCHRIWPRRRDKDKQDIYSKETSTPRTHTLCTGREWGQTKPQKSQLGMNLTDACKGSCDTCPSERDSVFQQKSLVSSLTENGGCGQLGFKVRKTVQQHL